MRILKELNPEDLIFFDIETARLVKELEIDSPLFDSWAYKKKREDLSDQEIVESYYKESGLFPEFSRIVSIAVGVIRNGNLYLNVYDDEDESELLKNFHEFIGTVQTQRGKNTRLCGFANKGFDSPFIFKRSIINGVEVHDLLDTGGLKPWELTEVDLKEVWKGTAWNTASLLNIAVAFGLPSPKDDINGAEVGKVFWEEGVERISKYCKKDVITTCHIFQKMRGDEPSPVKATPKKETVGLMEYLYNGGSLTKKLEAQLKKTLDGMNKTERAKAKVLLGAIPAKTKTRRTRFTKEHIDKLWQE